ncbi:S-adenosylmethionine synthetase [Kitasatospora gansuensis]|uniref:S-adenosylmethionine synthetase n=1 Tax=Kitasatospora gansuensis TaxID=258050 RepID=A0A7W7S947_9ACTN|nr:hypothetical protein [Kitasatospora gansuensis]MBB4945947.1 S-adenosylmethionine synthetase [Kitasatospora gansuensis]
MFCDRVGFYATRALADRAVAADLELAACDAAEAWAVGKRLADLF